VNLLSGSLANTLIDGLYGVAILSGGNSTSGGACTGSCKNEISNAGADISVIAGGYDNVIGGTYANIAGTIVGGGHNTLDQAGGHGFIGGGSANICSGTPDGYCSIPGGTANTINGNVGTIAGGQSNTIGANAAYGVISGGNTNAVNASVNYGTITGGQDNTVSKSYATAIGRKVAARYYGAVTQAAGSISAQGDAQTSVVLLRKQTANNTPIVLNADGTAEHILIPNDSTFGFEATIVARDTVANESAMYTCSGVIDNNGGTVTAVAALTNTMVAEDDAGWAAVCAADDSINALTITVTGDATNLTNWAARVELVEVTG
jgi:hypothetical protein